MMGPRYTPKQIVQAFPIDAVKPPKTTTRPQEKHTVVEGEPPFVDLFRKLDLNPQGPNQAEGGTIYEMSCLRDDAHTEPGDPRAMFATFWPDGGIRHWACRHAHCDGLVVKDWVAIAQARGLEAPQQHPAPQDPGSDLWGTGSLTASLDEGDAAWPAPLPLVSKLEPEAYPLDALPETIRAAVEEVQAFVQAPMPLVACSALAAVSLACQAHYDIQRAEKLSGPTGVFLVTIADSGERKSSCDGFFFKPIRDYERQQAEEAQPFLKEYRANVRAWQSRCKGLEDGIRTAAKGNKDTSTLEASLRALAHDEPQEPRVPRLLYADATPESLKFNLAFKWPSGGVVSSEAGIVLGSHGMGSDSVMRNLATYNMGWDGTAIQTERRTSESFTVPTPRLTMFLQVQEPTLRSFMSGAGELARGSGFLARCLVAWPESTQGGRPFLEAPPAWPHQNAFNRRLEAILAQPVPINEDGSLSPGMLTLSPQAKAEWVAFHDRIERELGIGGRFHDIRDVASKIPDNATRLAGLFHVFSGTIGSSVGIEHLKAGCRIAEWHLGEARRFFGEMALPAAIADAARLDAWLINTCQKRGVDQVSNSDIQHSGPSRLRESAAIDKAMAVLAELDRARQCKEGRRRFILVNPALLSPVQTAPQGLAVEILAVPAVLEPSEPDQDPKNRKNRNFINRNPPEPETQFPTLPAVSGDTYTEDL